MQLILILFLVFVACGATFYFYKRRVAGKRISESLKLKLFLVRLPKTKTEGKDLKEEINIFEQFLSAVLNFKKPIIFEVAVPYVGQEIHFYVAVSGELSEPLQRTVQSLWNDAQVEAISDYNIFNYSGVVSAAYVKQKEDFVMPLRTYREIGADTFLPFLGALTKINEVGEGGALQFIVRPASKSAKKRAQSVMKMVKKGGKLSDIMRHPLAISFKDISRAVSPKTEEKKKEIAVDEAEVKMLEAKLAKPFFEANVRIVASAPSQYQADSILEGLLTGFSQFGTPERNEFKIIRPKNLKDIIYQFSFREWDKDQTMVLTSEEMASLFHFPTAFTEIPKIKLLKAREAPPPANLPSSGVVIGESAYRGEVKAVRIADDDRRRHVYIVGQTGTGKSNLLTSMASQDIREGKGVAVIDPHGELVENILSLIPKKRFNDVIVFDPSDINRPLGLNMIEYDFNRPEQKTFIVNEMIGIFDKLYDLKTTGGPMFEQYMRNALLLLMEDEPQEPATLMEVARIFTDAEWRNKKLKRIHNPTVIDFWEKEAVKAGGEAALSNMTPYITSKFNAFTANDYMRVIIGQNKSSFNFREAMDEGKILLISLSKGKIGDINANLLGMIFVGKLLMAALGRADLPEEKRRDFNLYIDEFQNFTTDSVSVILSEARKYRLNLTIAHQFIAQLNEKIRDAVFGNVGSIVSFRIGMKDAEFLTKQFEPVFGEQDLINIDNFKAYARILIGGEPSKPFNIRTLRSEVGDLSSAKELKEISAAKYGGSREEIEKEIYKRLRE